MMTTVINYLAPWAQSLGVHPATLLGLILMATFGIVWLLFKK